MECADFVLLNKADLAPGGPEGDGVAQLGAIVASLNPLATVLACTHGKVGGRPARRGDGVWGLRPAGVGGWGQNGAERARQGNRGKRAPRRAGRHSLSVA